MVDPEAARDIVARHVNAPYEVEGGVPVVPDGEAIGRLRQKR